MDEDHASAFVVTCFHDRMIIMKYYVCFTNKSIYTFQLNRSNIKTIQWVQLLLNTSVRGSTF